MAGKSFVLTNPLGKAVSTVGRITTVLIRIFLRRKISLRGYTINRTILLRQKPKTESAGGTALAVTVKATTSSLIAERRVQLPKQRKIRSLQ